MPRPIGRIGQTKLLRNWSTPLAMPQVKICPACGATLEERFGISNKEGLEGLPDKLKGELSLISHAYYRCKACAESKPKRPFDFIFYKKRIYRFERGKWHVFKRKMVMY